MEPTTILFWVFIGLTALRANRRSIARGLACIAGIHDWEFKKAHYTSPLNALLAVTNTKATRTCRKCKKVQERDIHLLGLNPPEYVEEWRTIRRTK